MNFWYMQMNTFGLVLQGEVGMWLRHKLRCLQYLRSTSRPTEYSLPGNNHFSTAPKRMLVSKAKTTKHVDESEAKQSTAK